MWFKKRKGGNNRNEMKEPEIREVSIDEMRQAVNAYAKQLNPAISLRTIVKDNNEIDCHLLYEQLKCKPDKPFYMSKETFEIFEDPDYPRWIDQCQVACDQFYLDTGNEPVAEDDPRRKVSIYKIKDYLREEPPIDLYLHPQDRMVTHREPEKK
ncbi:hypothetical protein CR205_14755 [Alteribacter lacisalsi]|uniref:DUF3939 domain-containing protein n=1 Tax=Alteribacter lacisalsi TaxID=2045244 RepID=A0A2W0H7H4_9BACI|nr:DUF3939 domain-containing protein [Alteribacter lacisalsi]PYZ96931.1 hypothetical protein CR205_14755 [Alteribacter lacisalsi]